MVPASTTLSLFGSTTGTSRRRLTGQVNGKGRAMEFSNPFCGVSEPGFGSSSVVMTSPKVHGEVVSILTWYSLRQTLKRGRHIPSHSEFVPEMPLQHFPKSSFPASLSNDISRNSKTPEDSACDNSAC
jgi:hypothetical protein